MRDLHNTAMELEKPLKALQANLLPENKPLKWHGLLSFRRLRNLRRALIQLRNIIESREGHMLFPELWRDEYVKWFNAQAEKLAQLRNEWRRGWQTKAESEFTPRFATQFNNRLRLLIKDFMPVVKEAKAHRRDFLQTASMAALAFATGCGFHKDGDHEHGYYIRMERCIRRERAVEELQIAKSWGVDATVLKSKDGKYHVLLKGSYINPRTAAATMETVRSMNPRIPRDRDFTVVHIENGIVEWKATVEGERHQAERASPGIYIQLGAFKKLNSAFPLADEGAIIHRIPDEHKPELPYRAFKPRRYETVNEAFLDLRSVTGEAGIAEVFEDGLTVWLSQSAERVVGILRTPPTVDERELAVQLAQTSSEPFASFVEASIKRYPLKNGRWLSPVLVHAVKRVESGNDPQATSRKGARGLMQLMAPTFADCLKRSRHPRKDWARREPKNAITDPELNIDAGTSYLAWLMEYFAYDTKKAVTAYNAGPGRVRRAEPLPKEARAYRPKVAEQVNELLSSKP